jgi:guanylate kinase
MIVTLTGPTCGGKSTLERELQARGFGRAVSHTTREARSGEVCGEHYHFVNDCTYDAMNARGDYIETIDLGTRRYAMSKASLELAASQGHVVIVVEPHGAGQIADYCKKHGLPHMGVWVDCTTADQAQRWLHRTIGEVMVTTGPGAFKAAVERLGLMLGHEQEWSRDARAYAGPESHPRLYKFFVDSSRQTADQLADQVLTMVNVIRQTEHFRDATAALNL